MGPFRGRGSGWINCLIIIFFYLGLVMEKDFHSLKSIIVISGDA